MPTGPSVAIVADSAAALPPELTGDSRIDIVPMQYTFGDETYLDGRDLDPTSFYRMLKEAPVLPTTSAPSPASYLEAFQRAASRGRSVVCLTVASQFSSSHDSAMAAAREAEGLPGATPIVVLDTESAAGGEGLVVVEAWRAANRGLGLDEVVGAARSVIPRVKLFAFLDTLFFLWRGGRVHRLAYAGSSLLKIKPLLEMTRGQVRGVGRPRTASRAEERLLTLMRREVGEARVHATVIHADSAEAAERLRDRVESEFTCDDLFVSEFSPVMGTHTGPGLLGVAFWA